MNIDAIRKYGSLEFRGMEGTADSERIKTWCKALVNLRDACVELNEPNSVFELYAHVGASKFAKHLLGDKYEMFVYPNMTADIQRCFSISLDFPYAYSNGIQQQKELV